jgi:hypothetical protein
MGVVAYFLSCPEAQRQVAFDSALPFSADAVSYNVKHL